MKQFKDFLSEVHLMIPSEIRHRLEGDISDSELSRMIDQYDDPFVMNEIARNPKSSDSTLQKLQEKYPKNHDIHNGIVNHKNVSDWTLRNSYSAFPNSSYIASGISRNPNASSDLLDTVYKDKRHLKNAFIFDHLVKNKNTSMNVISDMWNNHELLNIQDDSILNNLQKRLKNNGSKHV